MWSGAFRKDVVRLLILVPVVLVFAACMLLGAFERIGP
jgi:hypothetical protein